MTTTAGTTATPGRTAFPLPVRGPFSLAASARFLEGFSPARYPGSADDVVRLAFPVDGTDAASGIAVRQDDDGGVTMATDGPVPDRLADQVARILSLDVDGSGLPAVVAGDPVVAGLAAEYPGLRPVCFCSPYEAACWAVLSQRSSILQAAAVKERIAQRFGTRHDVDVDVDGVELWAFPAPARLRAAAGELPVPEVERQRLAGLAEAALDGRLDARRLRAVPAEEARAAVLELPGIGPFSADLVVIRGAGAPDVLPTAEPRLTASLAELHGLTEPSPAELTALAERWRPYRWVSVLVRTDRERRTGEITGRWR